MPASPKYAQLDLIEAPVFVLEVNASGQPVYAAFNVSARKVTGRPLSDYLGRTACEVYEGTHGRLAFQRHCGVIQSGVTAHYELLLPIGGDLRNVRTTLRPEKNERGDVVRLYGTSIDISAEQEARAAKADHEFATTEMEQFIAMAAHDLRAPMRHVAMLAETLKEGFKDHGDGKLQLIEMMDELSAKTSALINDVLDHAQMVDGGCKEGEVDLADLVSTLADVLDPQARHSMNVTPMSLHTDRTALQVALRNLAENAIKHAGDNSVSLAISVRPAEDGMIEFTVEDDGNGFSEAGLDLMGGGTFRVDSGYGLFGVRRIIRARGGRLSAGNSPLTGGALVQFTLPGRILSGLQVLMPDRPAQPSIRA